MSIRASGTLGGQQALFGPLPPINPSFSGKSVNWASLAEHGTTQLDAGCSISKRYMLKQRRAYQHEWVYDVLLCPLMSRDIVHALYFMAFL